MSLQFFGELLFCILLLVIPFVLDNILKLNLSDRLLRGSISLLVLIGICAGHLRLRHVAKSSLAHHIGSIHRSCGNMYMGFDTFLPQIETVVDPFSHRFIGCYAVLSSFICHFSYALPTVILASEFSSDCLPAVWLYIV